MTIEEGSIVVVNLGEAAVSGVTANMEEIAAVVVVVVSLVVIPAAPGAIVHWASYHGVEAGVGCLHYEAEGEEVCFHEAEEEEGTLCSQSLLLQSSQGQSGCL